MIVAELGASRAKRGGMVDGAEAVGVGCVGAVSAWLLLVVELS